MSVPAHSSPGILLPVCVWSEKNISHSELVYLTMRARKKSPNMMLVVVAARSITVILVNSCPNIVSQHSVRNFSLFSSSSSSKSSSVIASSGSSSRHVLLSAIPAEL